jgi:hypothetical protein
MVPSFPLCSLLAICPSELFFHCINEFTIYFAEEIERQFYPVFFYIET